MEELSTDEFNYKYIPKTTYIGSQPRTGKSGVSFRIAWFIDSSKHVIRSTVFDVSLLSDLKVCLIFF